MPLKSGTRAHVRTKRRPHSEDETQKAIVSFLRAVLVNAQVASVPNGGARSKAEAGILKATGVLPGMADLIIIAPRGRVHLIEVKATKGVLSVEQKKLRDWCILNSVPWCIARSIDDARRAISMWGLESREVAR